MATYDVVTFLSDFGRRDIFVGVCHGVLARGAPHARVIDLTHEVPAHDVLTGALLLARAVAHLPSAVHLAVVDPGVGTDRRGIALAVARGDVLVGPDNGLLLPATDELGGVIEAYGLPANRTASATFDGRDVFAPAAARIASGKQLAELGPPITDLKTVTVPVAEVEEASVHCRVLLVDRFGNCQLSATPADAAAAGLPDVMSVTTPRAEHRAHRVRAFGDLEPHHLGLIEDSDGQLALVLPRAAAAAELGIEPGDRIVLRP
ncbi:MAG: SAM-dependent chlorinase/fluorinase [Actinobacteria bacterium]|nr:SAM-dependent chlorinase/fluorinase [Actinomycetota bacterium]